MRRILYGLGTGVLAAMISAGGVYAQAPEGVTVTGSRVVTAKIGQSNIGATINEVTLAYRISYADLDLSSGNGQAMLEKRVREAADAACKEISRSHPGAQPSDVECARKATDGAMVQVREVIAAARK